MPFDFLKKYIEPKIWLQLNQDKKNLRIKETDKQAKLKEMNIFGIDGDCFAFRLDSIPRRRFAHLFLKANADKIHKGVDGVIFYKTGDRKYVILCELKSDNLGNPKDKFASSNAFIDYICSLAYRLYGEKLCQFQRANIVFSLRANVNKRPIVKKDIRSSDFSEINVKAPTGFCNINELLKHPKKIIECKKCPIFES
jgi:hypothetical protein